MADPGEGPPPPLFFDQNEARRTEKNFGETAPPLSQGLDDPSPPPPTPLSEGLDPPLSRTVLDFGLHARFCIPGTGFQSLSVELGFWIPIVCGIPDFFELY